MKRVIISDLHLGAYLAPFAWMTDESVGRLYDFLASPVVQNADQLILAGDVLDTWVYPIDRIPPTPRDVIYAPHNRPVFHLLELFAQRPGKQVIWLPGNHDMATTAADAYSVSPCIVFGKHFDEPPLRVRHGHEGSLFNAPDPEGKPYPVGYFITRMTATGAARGHGNMNLDLWTVLRSGREVAKALKGQPLSQCVFDVVMKATGVTAGDTILMPDGSTVKVADVRVMYDSLAEAWDKRGGDCATAVLAEWDPWYDLDAPEHMNIVGHSHVPMYSESATYFGYYLNAGTWCANEPDPTWVEVWDEEDMLCARVVHLSGDVSTTAWMTK